MEIESSVAETGTLDETAARMFAAAERLEQAADRLRERHEEAEASIGRILATTESRRESDLEAKLAVAEARIGELEARASSAGTGGRRTAPASAATLLSKGGVAVEGIEAGTLDAAMTSLSLEQRMAVKAQLMRAGLLG